jgi:DnaJ-class molecular chaperone
MKSSIYNFYCEINSTQLFDDAAGGQALFASSGGEQAENSIVGGDDAAGNGNATAAAAAASSSSSKSSSLDVASNLYVTLEELFTGAKKKHRIVSINGMHCDARVCDRGCGRPNVMLCMRTNPQILTHTHISRWDWL